MESPAWARWRKLLDQALLWGLVTTIACAVLAFGATQSWSTFALEAAAALLLSTWAARQAAAGAIEIPANQLYLPMLGFALVVLWQIVAGATAYSYATRMELLRYVAYGIVFVVAEHTVAGKRRRGRLLFALSLFGIAVAILAVLQNLTSPARIYWRFAVPGSGSIFGPYANHGNYAGLMEMLAPIPIVMWLTAPTAKLRNVLLGLGGLLMSASIFLSRSRGGMLAFGVQALFLGGYLLARHRSKTVLLKMGAVVAVIVAAVIFLGPPDMAASITSLRTPLNPNTSGDRLTIARDSLHMIAARPVAGWGLDTFPVVYPHFRSFATAYFINEAHNDLLQVVVETGFIGFALTLWFLGATYSMGFRILRRNLDPATLAALVGITGLLAHSLTDFNMHIPANAAIFFMLCALATTEGHHARAGEASGRRQRAYEIPQE